MKQIGLTGGLGAGKSLVARVFKAIGIPVYDSDLAARRLMEEDSHLKRELTALFGADVFDAGGRLERKKIAAKVFENEELLASLNAIVHPAVKEDYSAWVNKQDDSCVYVIREAAIMLETGLYRDLDSIILVDAPEELRIERVMKRDGRSREEIQAILSRQWVAEKKREFASFVINNDGKDLILPVIINIHQQLIHNGAAETH
jgi:dephospho-CoA kinase